MSGHHPWPPPSEPVLLPSLTEAQFQTMIVDRAKARGWMVHHARAAPTRSGGYATPIQGHAGFPDLILAKNGTLIIAELKAEKKYPRPEQREWLEHLIGEGRTVVVWRPRDWPKIVELLDQQKTP